MAWGRRRSWFGHFKNQKSTSLGNRGGILGRQETCPAKGQMRWGLERQFGGAEGWRMNLGSHLQTPGERLGFVVEWGSPQGPEERGQMRAAPCGRGAWAGQDAVTFTPAPGPAGFLPPLLCAHMPLRPLSHQLGQTSRGIGKWPRGAGVGRRRDTPSFLLVTHLTFGTSLQP